MASAGVVGSAYIEILPLTTRFDREMRRDVDALMDRLERRVEAAGENMEEVFRELARTVQRQGELIERAMTEAALSMPQSMEMSGERMEDVFRELTRTVQMQGEMIENAISEAGMAMSASMEFAGERIEDVFRETARSAQRNGEMIERAYAEAGRGASRKMNTAMSFGIGALGAQMATMAAQVGIEVTKAGIEMTGVFDKAQSSFTALTGSAEEGKRLLEDVKEFAFKTPFDVKDLADTTRNLLAQGRAFGVTKDNVLDYAEIMGDAIAITGGGELEMMRTTRALGQMGSSSKVMAQDMNQLQQSIPGIPVWQALADGLGVTQEEARKMGKDGLIPGAQAANILVGAMRDFPGAAGEMQRQAQTVTGALQNFQEQAMAAFSDSLRPFTDVLRTTLQDPAVLDGIRQLGDGFGQILSSLTPLIPALAQMSGTLGGVFGSLAQSIAPALETLAPMLVTFFEQAAPILESFGETFGLVLQAVVPLLEPLGEVALLVGGVLAAAFEATSPALEAIGEAFSEVAAALTPVISQVGDDLAPLFAAMGELTGELLIALIPLLPPLTELAIALLPVLVDVLLLLVPVLEFATDLIADYLAPAIAWLGEKLSETIVSVQEWIGGWEGLRSKLMSVWNAIKGIPGHLGRLMAAAGEQIAGFGEAVWDGLTAAYDAVIGAGGAVAQWFMDLPGLILDAIVNMPAMLAEGFGYAIGFALAALYTYLTEWLPQLLEWGAQFVVFIGQSLVSLGGKLLELAWNGLTMFLEGLATATPLVLNFVAELPGRIISAGASLAGRMLNWGMEGLRAVWDGMKSLAGWLTSVVPLIPGWILQGLASAGEKMLSVGENIVKGIWNGIKNMTGWIGDRIKGFASGLVKGFTDAFKIFSPSRVFADEVGAPLAQGIGVGFEKELGKMSPKFDVNNNYGVSLTGQGGGGNGGFNFHGPVSFGADMRTSTQELDWAMRRKMGAGR